MAPSSIFDCLLLPCIPFINVYDKICENWYFKAKKWQKARQTHPQCRQHSHSKGPFNTFERQLDMRKSETQPDQKPGFANLPLEIRLMIYDFVFDGMREIHILLKDGRIHGIPCTGYRPVCNRKHKDTKCRCPVRWETEEFRAAQPIKAKMTLGIPSLLPLLPTCQFMHSEISDLTYMRKTFIFSTPEALLLFPFSLAPLLLHKIRTIQFDSLHDHFGKHCLVRFDQDILQMPQPIRNKFQNAYPVRTIDVFKDYGPPSGRGPPSVWGAACEMVGEMKGLDSIKVFLDYSNFDFLWAEMLDDEDCGGEHTMWSYECAFQPMTKAAEMLGGGVQFEVTTNWKIGVFGDVGSYEVKLWKWVKNDDGKKGEFC